jgi:hypothetical protein
MSPVARHWVAGSPLDEGKTDYWDGTDAKWGHRKHRAPRWKPHRNSCLGLKGISLLSRADANAPASGRSVFCPKDCLCPPLDTGALQKKSKFFQKKQANFFEPCFAHASGVAETLVACGRELDSGKRSRLRSQDAKTPAFPPREGELAPGSSAAEPHRYWSK